jgi:hypothetical protein
MNKLASAIRPKSGFAHFVHLLLTVLLPILIYILVRIDFAPLAASLVILIKWGMFAVRPRYWPANIRANGVDIMYGLSTVVFMTSTGSVSWQIAWAVSYGLWLLFIKPGSNVLYVSLQAGISQLAALTAVFLKFGDAPLVVLVFACWLVCYICARHFFSSFDEPYSSLYAHTWGYFAAALVWVLGHWLLFYGVLAQPTLILTVMGYGLAALYYLDSEGRLSTMLRRQFIWMMVAIIVVVLTFSDWGDKAI